MERVGADATKRCDGSRENAPVQEEQRPFPPGTPLAELLLSSSLIPGSLAVVDAVLCMTHPGGGMSVLPLPP